ncbi:hypothetical protein D3C86_1682410 [compost metagenome]
MARQVAGHLTIGKGDAVIAGQAAGEIQKGLGVEQIQQVEQDLRRGRPRLARRAEPQSVEQELQPLGRPGIGLPRHMGLILGRRGVQRRHRNVGPQGVEKGADPGLIGRQDGGVQGLGPGAEQAGNAGATGAGQPLGGGGEVRLADRQFQSRIEKGAHSSVVTTILPMAVRSPRALMASWASSSG